MDENWDKVINGKNVKIQNSVGIYNFLNGEIETKSDDPGTDMRKHKKKWKEEGERNFKRKYDSECVHGRK